MKIECEDRVLVLRRVARFCHEANRAYCQSIGDDSQPVWDNAPDWQQDSAVNGVRFHAENQEAGAGASHANWLAEKEREGWKYGPVKDPVNKEHPCFLPFGELPVEQQVKDHIFRSVVHAFIEDFMRA